MTCEHCGKEIYFGFNTYFAADSDGGRSFTCEYSKDYEHEPESEEQR